MKTHLDLFSGIGGFALAAGWAGYQTVGFCEVEDYPRRILSKRFTGVRLHGDIRELNGSDYQGVSLITGGYPCQPFSQAGKRKGTADDRHLWPEMLRVVKQARPAFVVAENVAGHITMGLDEVLADLETEGYAARAVVVPACAVNAPHRRDRVWIIAKNAGDANSDSKPVMSVNDEAPELQSNVAHSGSGRRQGGELQTRRHDPGLCGTDVADTATKRTQGLRAGRIEESYTYDKEKVPVCGYERIGSSYWETEPGVGRVADGISNRVDRLKGLGNSIVPQVAYELIRHLGED